MLTSSEVLPSPEVSAVPNQGLQQTKVSGTPGVQQELSIELT